MMSPLVRNPCKQRNLGLRGSSPEISPPTGPVSGPMLPILLDGEKGGKKVGKILIFGLLFYRVQRDQPPAVVVRIYN